MAICLVSDVESNIIGAPTDQDQKTPYYKTPNLTMSRRYIIK
jgi:hypothetical protein